jgi:hypothetical protein
LISWAIDADNCPATAALVQQSDDEKRLDGQHRGGEQQLPPISLPDRQLAKAHIAPGGQPGLADPESLQLAPVEYRPRCTSIRDRKARRACTIENTPCSSCRLVSYPGGRNNKAADTASTDEGLRIDKYWTVCRCCNQLNGISWHISHTGAVDREAHKGNGRI